MPVTTREFVEGLPKQNSVLAANVASAMLSTETYRSYVGLKKQTNVQHYQLTARNLATPEKVVVKGRAINSLNNWHVHFMHDIFQDVHETESWKFPLLSPSDEFYSKRFRDPRHREFEVTVCPVYSQDVLMNGHDIIRMCVAAPELPPDHARKLSSVCYPSDIVNIIMCNDLFTSRDDNDGVIAAGSINTSPQLQGDFTSEEQSMFGRRAPVTDIVPVPAYWDFVFVSKHKNERSCGSKSMPQILAKLWFLRDSLRGGVEYCVKQLNQVSYVGVVKNVSGFNVYFQVNCDMPMRSLVRYLDMGVPRVPWETRMMLPNVPRINNVERRVGNLGTIEMDTAAYTNVLLVSEAGEQGGGADEIKERWRRVNTYVKTYLKSLGKAYTSTVERDARRSVALLVRSLLEMYSEKKESAWSGMYKERLAAAVWPARELVLRTVLEDMTAGELSEFLQGMGNDALLKKTVANVSVMELVHHVPAMVTDDELVRSVYGMVPSVFKSSVHLALYVYALPAALSDAVKVEIFGDGLAAAKGDYVKKKSGKSGLQNIQGIVGMPAQKVVVRDMAMDFNMTDPTDQNVKDWLNVVESRMVQG